MPLCKVTHSELIPWTDNSGNQRTGFRLTFEQVNADAISILNGSARPHYITMFGRTIENEIAFEQAIAAGKLPNRLVIAYPCKVKPYLRTYQQDTKKHQAGEFIMDTITGLPRVFDTIYVDCLAVKHGEEEVPENMSEVIARANNQREYWINNDDANGIRRFYEVDEGTPAAESFDQAAEDAKAAATADIDNTPPAQGTNPNVNRPNLRR